MVYGLYMMTLMTMDRLLKMNGGTQKVLIGSIPILKDKDGTLHMKQLPSWHDVNLHWVEADKEQKDNIVEVDFKQDDKG